MGKLLPLEDHCNGKPQWKFCPHLNRQFKICQPKLVRMNSNSSKENLTSHVLLLKKYIPQEIFRFVISSYKRTKFEFRERYWWLSGIYKCTWLSESGECCGYCFKVEIFQYSNGWFSNSWNGKRKHIFSRFLEKNSWKEEMQLLLNC